MNRFISVMSKSVAIAAFAVISSTVAQAQDTSTQSSGTIAPPPGVTNIVSVDAHNVVIVESQNPDAPSEPKQYSLFVPRHIYAGSIARLFGGSIMSTESMVLPESALRSNFGGAGGVSGIGGNGNTNNNGFSSGNSTNGGFGRSNMSMGNMGINNMGANQFNRASGLLNRPTR